MADRKADRPHGGSGRHPDTDLAHLGRDPHAHAGVVSPPVYHASTILYDGVEAFRHPERALTAYGRQGTPGTFALEEAMLALEGAEEGGICRLVPSGLAAVTEVLLAFSHAGAHILMPDNAYDPSRTSCDTLLERFGVETTYYDPLIGEGIADLIRENTTLLMLEIPGSRTFEMGDVRAFVAAAQARSVTTAIDNTWATPYYFKPLRFGVDVSINAATKFISGHSDLLMGTVTANKAAAATLNSTHRNLGHCIGPDDAYLALRGLRTLSVRMKRHMDSGLEVARWLEARDDVACVMHPALPSDPGHALWKRDMTGACGVFGFEMRAGTRKQADALLDAIEIFGLGFSFGGFESLIVPTDVSKCRTATQWAPQGPVFRLHVGLEHPSDLIADLARALDAYHSAR